MLPKECRPALLLWKGSKWRDLLLLFPSMSWSPTKLAHSGSNSFCPVTVVETTRCLNSQFLYQKSSSKLQWLQLSVVIMIDI